MLEDEIGELDEKHRQFVAVCELCAPQDHMAAYRWVGNGCPPSDRLALCKAFIAKAVWNFATTRDLIDAIRREILRRVLRRLLRVLEDEALHGRHQDDDREERDVEDERGDAPERAVPAAAALAFADFVRKEALVHFLSPSAVWMPTTVSFSC